MTKVKEKVTYAVVDIETTGGNAATGDRMIQFGCALIEEGKIVQQYAIDINPLVSIPKQIEHLTGISNQTVANAPYFEDVAPMIYNLLEGCIFVAHNIQFDYKFLSEELVRCGLPPLNSIGMDTVELAQILLPTEPSFRLNDLATRFGFLHDNPHQADSDAYVTAELFLLLKQKLKKLPLVTVEKLVELAEHCTMQTNLFFKETLSDMLTMRQLLSDDLLVKEGLAIRKKTVTYEQRTHRETEHYPVGIEAKEQLFQKKLTTRKLQIQMMDEVYRYFSEKDSEHFVIEAATGIGKTLGYLIPLAYVATPQEPVIISTYTTLLQKQLLEKDSIQLNTILPFAVQAAILKSKHHYIHLAKFQEVLKDPIEHQMDAILKMRTLTWLTETVTGDLDELNLTNYLQPFWNKIRHRGWMDNAQEDLFYEQDFYLHAQEKVKQASIIITNHAFICHDLQREEPVLPNVQKIIIDEAHHLADVATTASSEVFSYYRNQQLMKLIGKRADDKSFLSRLSALAEKSNSIQLTQINMIEMSVVAFEEELAAFFDKLISYCRSELPERQQMSDQLDVQFSKTENWTLDLKKKTKILLALMEDIVFLGYEITRQALIHREQFTHRERHLIDDFFELIGTVESQKGIFQKIFRESEQNEVTWFSFKQKSPKNSFVIKRSRIDSSEFLRTKLAEQTTSILYTGATLELNGDFSYFEKQLGEKKLRKMVIPSPYDYQKQARLWIPKELKPLKQLTKKQYAEMIVEHLETVIQHSNENMMVLFNANETLQDVFSLLQQHPAFTGRELLAQGLSGSRDRILKRFFHSTGGILLGADSFWEGVDLPGKSLRIIVVTRLPFESPDRPFTKAKYKWLESQQLSPFKMDTLPKATVRLKQGLGRLVRSEKDKGVMIVLDDRLIKTNYGQQMLASLPHDLVKEVVAKEELQRNLSLFLEED